MQGKFYIFGKFVQLETAKSEDDDGLNPGSQLFDLSQSQPLTDWSQTQPPPQWSQPTFSGFGDNEGFGFEQAPSTLASSSPSSTSVSTSHRSSQGVVPSTPVGTKRSASDDIQTPWGNKRGKTSGSDAILSLGKSVDNIGTALRDCFMPKESSAVSPTKQVTRARKIAEDDQEANVITNEQRAILSLIFGGDPKTADAYVAEKDSNGRLTLAKILISRF
ncbi:hypothetical protein C8R43DRAFT_1127079 [Mycena crocata]|nr:hypothetical protein C8R43DRAFT_1127079 [Mycena crocata]